MREPSAYSRNSSSRQQLEREAQRAKRVKLTAVGICAVALLVMSAVWNPPTAKVHSFSEISDYRPEKESGCTNSGKGCHGSETRYADFNDYHPNATCKSCHEYQGVGCIPCHAPRERECALCHDGTLEQATDAVRLADPYPRGHYRETTHTAMGTDMQREVRGAAGGKAKAACEDCHSRDLKKAHTAVEPVPGSPYGLDIGCGECHNDVRAAGMAEVLSDWKKRRCEDCHKVGTSAPMHSAEVADPAEGSGRLGCGRTGEGCHDGNDLHALHADAPKTCSGSAARGEPGCHDPEREASKAGTKSCGDERGGCHREYADTRDLHEHGDELHSPGNSTLGDDASYRGIACRSCHATSPDGLSLVTEHSLPSAAKSEFPEDSCRNCHNHPASRDAIRGTWESRWDETACASCHGRDGLDEPHAGASDAHETSSPGCSFTGQGCHPTNDLFEVGRPTTTANIHRDCLRCHDRTASNGNRAFDPSKKTCGTGRACHDGYDPRRSTHRSARGVTDGTDRKHTAGDVQRLAVLMDEASGVWTACGTCHDMKLGTEHARPNSVLAASANACTACHGRDSKTASTVKADWPGRGGAGACAACHAGKRATHDAIDTAHVGKTLALAGNQSDAACERSGCHATRDLRVLHRGVGCVVSGCHGNRDDINGRNTTSCGGLDSRTACHAGYSERSGHDPQALRHGAVELDEKGDVAPGQCMRSGCHPAGDLAKLHDTPGCAIEGCHVEGRAPRLKSCGGDDASAACHVGFTQANHFVSHDADRSGSVAGVTYGLGENEGCFGCHDPDLTAEHSAELLEGSMEAPASGPCRICHANADDPGTGANATLPAVRSAIAAQDTRCVACHDSGNAEDGPHAVASPHKVVSADRVLPPGAVWADPFAEWKAAFDGPTGSGHNSMSSEAVGAKRAKRFPLAEFELGDTTYTWALPPNTGATKWLKGVGDDDEAVRSVTVTCDDCHVIPEDMRGPQGAAVQVRIDEDYSQTGYAEPDRRALVSQFEATGTERVICFKCHTINAGSLTATDAPGGNPVHSRHARHEGFPSYNPVAYGEKCVDCHVRIPHAWRRPRLLQRTVETSDGAKPDAYPYVPLGSDGLRGIRLRSFDSPEDLQADSCVTGGCHGRHSAKSHPMPSDVPTTSYWP